MIRKLLLVRLKDSKATLLDDLGIKTLVTAEPYAVSPAAWAAEAGLSHYGYVLEMKLKQFKEVEKVLERNPSFTLLDVPNDKSPAPVLKEMSKWLESVPAGTTILQPEIDFALARVGLRVNPEAE